MNVVDSKGTVDGKSDADPSLEDTHHEAVAEIVANDHKGDDVPPPQAPVSKRAPGTKEPCPFRWKLIGESKGAILTLFKSVDRAEVESQQERAAAEGYYANLRIVEIDEKTVQPPSAARVVEPKPPVEVKMPSPKVKPAAEAIAEKTTAAGPDKAKATKKTAVNLPQPRKSVKPPRPSPAKAPARKVRAKKATKSRPSPKGKNKVVPKSTGKRAPKKK